MNAAILVGAGVVGLGAMAAFLIPGRRGRRPRSSCRSSKRPRERYRAAGASPAARMSS